VSARADARKQDQFFVAMVFALRKHVEVVQNRAKHLRIDAAAVVAHLAHERGHCVQHRAERTVFGIQLGEWLRHGRAPICFRQQTTEVPTAR